MRFGLAALFFFASISAAGAQAVHQGGPIVPPTPGHAPRWTGNKLIGDSGPAIGGPHGYGVTELNLTNNTGIAPLCINDTAITDPAGYRQTCFGSNVNGQGGLLSFNDGTYSVTSLPLTFQSGGILALNSNIQQITFQNLPPTVAGDVPVCINTATGQLFRASTVQAIVILTDPNDGFMLTNDDGSMLLTTTIPAGSCV